MNKEEIFATIDANDLAQIESLIKNGVDINSNGTIGVSPLFYACQKENVEAIQLLLSHGASVDLPIEESGFTPLHYAAQEGLMNIVEILVQAGANVNATDNWGNGPLWRAGNKAQIGNYLVSKGADPNMKNNSGVSPLNSPAVAYEYLKDPSKANSGERTSDLIKAVINQDITSIAMMTVKGKLNTEDTDESGKTALYIAAETGFEKIILLLIKQGANVNAKANNGSSILQIAEQKGHTNIAQMLKGAGAI